MRAKTIGGIIVYVGVLVLMTWVWISAPLVLAGALLIVGGWAGITIIEANRRIRDARKRWEHIYEEQRARTVDDEVDMMDAEGGFI